MIGFAKPPLDGDEAHPKHGDWFKEQAEKARAPSGCAKSALKRTAALRMVSRSLDTAPLAGGRVADRGHLRLQAPLPETPDEVCEMARAVGMGLAEAQRQALLALIDGADTKRAHPSYWAPFVVAGEGE